MANQLEGTRFGNLSFQEEDIYTLADGLVGFPNLTQFLLLEHRSDSPFRWLQSIEEPGLAFLCTDPKGFVSDYWLEVCDADAESLALSEATETAVLTTANIPAGDPTGLALNLAGPIVLNLETRSGKQFVFDDPRWPVRYQPFAKAAA